MRWGEGLGLVDRWLGTSFRGACWEHVLQAPQLQGSGCIQPTGDSAMSPLGWRTLIWVIRKVDYLLKPVRVEGLGQGKRKKERGPAINLVDEQGPSAPSLSLALFSPTPSVCLSVSASPPPPKVGRSSSVAGIRMGAEASDGWLFLSNCHHPDKTRANRFPFSSSHIMCHFRSVLLTALSARLFYSCLNSQWNVPD